MCLIYRKTFCINSWPHWDDEIHAAVDVFRDIFLYNPNIFLSNRVTQSRIDMAADKENIVNYIAGRYCPIGTFSGPDYELDFCICEKLNDRRFALIFDSDPGDDGEPVPNEDTKPDCFVVTGTG